MGNVPNGSSTKTGAQYDFLLEVRSTDQAVLQEMRGWFNRYATAIVERRGLTIGDNFTDLAIGPPVELDSEIRTSLKQHAGQLNISATELPSGAGHDAMQFQRAGVPSGMIFIAHGNNGISHNPAEILGLRPEDDPFALDAPYAQAVRLIANSAAGGEQARCAHSMTGFTDHLKNHGAREFHI